MLKRLRTAHPILYCILAEVLFLGSLFLTSLVLTFGLAFAGADFSTLNEYLLNAAQELVGVAVAWLLLRRTGQQEIAVPAAAVNDVGPGQTAAVQQLVHVVLHEQFQKERTAAEGPQGTLGMDGVDEPLDAGKVGGVEQERRFPAQLCGSVQQGKDHC